MNVYHKLRALLIWGLIAFPVVCWSQQGNRVSMLSHIPFENELNDVWGYVDGEGTEYGLVGTTTGTAIIRLADPANPEQLFFVPGATSPWRDIKTFGTYAYVSNEQGGGLAVIDLSDLPNSIRFKDTVIQEVNTIHNLWQADGYLYCAGLSRNLFNGGIMILDLNTDPWRPQFAGAYAERYVHDVYVRDNKAYLAEVFQGFLTIADFSNKQSPEVLGSRSYPGAFTHNTWLNDAGDVCFTTDETGGAYITAWDVSDPADIRYLDRIQTSQSGMASIPHNVHVKEDFLVTSYYMDGVQIVDASRPENLVEVGYFDTHPNFGASFDGAWGAYPFLPSGLILVSDITQGFFVLQPTYLRACYFEGAVTDATDGKPLAGVKVKVLDTELEEMTDIQGEFKSGTATPGTYTAVASKFGYFPDTFAIALENGVVAFETRQLTPIPNGSLSVAVTDSATGEALSGAQVLVVAPQQQGEFEFLSDTLGLWENESLPQSEYQLIVGKWGYRSQAISINTTSPASVRVELAPGYYDDFSLDFGWSVNNQVRDGQWERGIPKGTEFLGERINPDRDDPEDIGDKAYITGNQGITYNDDDLDVGTTLLISPEMDLGTVRNPTLNYSWWYVNIQPIAGLVEGDDTLYVRMETPDTSITLAKYPGPLNNTWNKARIPLPTLDKMDRITFVFQASDELPGNFVEAGIDHFFIEAGATTAALPALEAGWRLFPIPVEDILHLEFMDLRGQSQPSLLEIIDLHGRTVFRREMLPGSGTFSMPFSHPSGWYTLKMTRSGQVSFQRFVKR